MQVQQIMSKQVCVVLPDVDARTAWLYMRDQAIRHLVVVDGDRVVGIVSERDLGGDHGDHLRADRTVADLMTPHALTIAPDTDVREVAKLLRGLVIGCLPIVDGKQLVGIVTTRDLLDLVAAGEVRPPRPERGGKVRALFGR